MNQRRGLDMPCRNRLNAEPLGQAAHYAIRATVASSWQGQRHDPREFRSHAGFVYFKPSPDHHRAGNARQPVSPTQRLRRKEGINATDAFRIRRRATVLGRSPP